MVFSEKKVTLRDGRTITLRSAEPEDAEALLRYLKATTAESPYLLRGSEEITMTVGQEQSFVQGKKESPRELLLLAFCGDEHIGTCSIDSVGSFERCRHRCGLGIALYRKYCGLGIGGIMLNEVLETAYAMGYEQAELEVIAGNTRAIHLYEKLGFRKYGTMPDNLKYQDGSYADAVWMMKKLTEEHD